ncbi:unnamed protein product [Trichogramma brassicae]|uniref:Uncharacterized protein n=1 Tax=Trichogramma brassicae TaxID=86971 RepID=A0A6H5IU57_9HYME|nr:unnamed protein product [Trichogramma brassicae]
MGPRKRHWLLPGRLGVNEEPSDESESDSERETGELVRGRTTQRSCQNRGTAMVTPTDSRESGGSGGMWLV